MATAGHSQAADTVDGSGALGRGACGASELKDLLATLSTQIADADRRHSEAIREMHDRLSRLGSHSDSLKASLPPTYASVFSRIEDGMSELAARLAHSSREPATHVPPPLPWQVPAPQAAILEPSAMPAEDPGASLANVVRALQAGSRAASAAEPERAAEPAKLEAVDTLSDGPVAMAALRAPQIGDEPWDDNAAAALVELYDSGEAGLPPGPARETPADHAAEHIAEARLSAPEIEREWLESKLAEVASRVEQSLTELRPESSLLALGERFEKLEQHFTGMLGEVATRSDVEGLRLVEAHIAELTQQIEGAQAQLARLDSIEAQFGELKTKLTDEHIVELFGSLVPTEDDLSRFAEDAAGRVADKVVANLPSPEAAVAGFASMDHTTVAAEIEERTGRQIGELQNMLSSLIDERRRDEASKTEALETVQLGMQQLLDRIEAMEEAARNAPAAPAPMPMPMHHAPLLAQTQPVQDVPQMGRGAPDPRQAPARPLDTPPPAAIAPPSARSFAEEAKAAAARAAAAGGNRAAPRAEPRLEMGRPTPAGLAEAMRSAPEPAGSDPQSRDQILSLARQAAEKAQATARSPSVAAPAPAAKPAGLKDRLFGGPGAGKSGGVRPGMLIAATVAAFVLTGYFFVSGPKLRQGPAQIQRVQPGLPAPDGGEQPAEAPAEKAPAKPAAKDGAQAPAAGPDKQSAVERTGNDAFARGSAEPVTSLPPEGIATNPGNGLPGVTVQTGARQMHPEEMMRARQRAHIANMSERAAMNAARTSAMPDAAVPAAVRDAVPNTTGSVGGERKFEMPPLQIGPSSLRQAAASGDPSAQFEVAARFAEGKGVDQSFEQAAVWYQRAAAQGLVQAQYRLATLFERGLGMKADLNRARAWYKRAADQGNVKAMHNLAVLSTGKDQAPDYQTASLWFSAAADRGLVDSQYNLGILYESGLGVEKDLVSAFKWYSLASKGGDRDATRRRDLVKAKLDQASLRKAQEEVDVWHPMQTDAMANEPRIAGEAWKRRAEAQ